MKFSPFWLLAILYVFSSLSSAQKAIEFKAGDGVLVSADLYNEKSQPKTVIVLFHQAGSSRGEYRTIAPHLTELGYTSLAVDQRSGNRFGGVKNKTASRVKVGNDFPTALPDMRAAILYAKNTLKAERVVIWGSSYSASLSLVLAGRKEVPIDGVLAFSPGEYFGGDISVKKEVSRIEVPVFITSARGEVRGWQSIFDAIPVSEQHVAYKPKGKGRHGSSTLLSSDSAEYWEAIEFFLSQHFSES